MGRLGSVAAAQPVVTQEKSCFVSDGSPAEQSVDHRQVQRELAEVSVYLQRPLVLSPTTAKISWNVSF